MSYNEFVVKTDPTINPAHGQNVEAAIGAELYDTPLGYDEYQTVDPIGGSMPTGRLPHNEMLSDD